MDRQQKKNMCWNAAGSFIYLASQWIVTVLVTRFFGYADAGVLSLAMSISASFQTVAMFGIRHYQVSDIDNKYENSCYVMLRNITCFAALILCMLFSFLNNYNITQVMAILGFMLFRLSESYSDVIQGIAQKNNRLDVAGKGLALKGSICLLCFFAGYYFGGSLTLCLMLMSLSAWLITLFFDLNLTEKICKFRLTFNFKKSMQLCKVTLPLCVYLFLSSTITVVPKYILEKMCGETILGGYSSIFAPATIIHAAAIYIYTPFVGKFAKLFKNKDYNGFFSLMIRIVLVIVLIGAICVVASIFLGDWGLQLIYGESIIEYSSFLMWVMIATIFIGVASFVFMLGVVVRDFKGLIISNCISLFCAIVFSFFLINIMGADGTSVSIMISALGGIVYILTSIKLLFKKNISISEGKG